MKNCVVVLGRFQGFTKKHYKIISKAKKENKNSKIVVAIVNGLKSSKNVDVNPFTYFERCKMIKKCFPEVLCIKISRGFLMDLLKILAKLDYNIKRIYCGSDRAMNYKDQIKRLELNIEVRSIKRDFVSATLLRESLQNHNIEKFKQLSPPELWEDFEVLSRKYNRRKEHFNERKKVRR